MIAEEIRGDADSFPAGLRVLAVDDDPTCLKLLGTLLRKCQYNGIAICLNSPKKGCNIVSQCCNSYEFCVSCCLNPEMTRKELALKVKVAKPATARIYISAFDYCTGRCRHSSESVVHENAYISEHHHYFSIPSNSSVSVSTQRESRLVGINVIIGRQGESCDSVCKSKGQSCVPNKLAVLNQWWMMLHHICDRYEEFQKLNTEVLGVSIDSVFSHLAWVQTHRKSGGLGDLQYPLVSDVTKSILKSYGVLIPDQGIALRGLFIIDKVTRLHVCIALLCNRILRCWDTLILEWILHDWRLILCNLR